MGRLNAEHHKKRLSFPFSFLVPIISDLFNSHIHQGIRLESRQTLRENGLDLDTHIIFFSDHGDMHGSHGMFRKTNPYEEAVHIPFIIGGEMPMTYYDSKSGDSDVLVNHVDVAPTTLGLCDLDIPEWMEGTDYSWVRVSHRSQGEVPDSAYLQSVVPTRHYDSIDLPYRGIVTRDGWKYVCLENQEWLMFN